VGGGGWGGGGGGVKDLSCVTAERCKLTSNSPVSLQTVKTFPGYPERANRTSCCIAGKFVRIPSSLLSQSFYVSRFPPTIMQGLNKNHSLTLLKQEWMRPRGYYTVLHARKLVRWILPAGRGEFLLRFSLWPLSARSFLSLHSKQEGMTQLWLWPIVISSII